MPRADRFGERSVALMGGLGFLGAFLLAMLYWASPISEGQPAVLRTVLGTLIGMTAILVGLGFLDDRRGVDPTTKLSVQAFCAVASLMVLYETMLRSSGGAAQVLLLGLGGLFVVGLSNSVNMLDNMDGLAAGSVWVSCVGLSALSWRLGHPQVALVAGLLGASLVGFLVFNAPVVRPARLFMGDSGSLPMGYLLGVVMVWLLVLERDAVWLWCALPLAAAVPLGDTAFVLWRRKVEGRPLMLGGQDHLSHCLVRAGFSPGRVFALFLGASLWTVMGLTVAGMVRNWPLSLSWSLVTAVGWGLACRWLARYSLGSSIEAGASPRSSGRSAK